MKQLKQLIAHPMPALANRYVIKLNLFHLETFLVSLRLATIAVVHENQNLKTLTSLLLSLCRLEMRNRF